MVAIVAGNSLGLLNTSLRVLGSGDGLGQAAQGRAGEQVYVNGASGNLVIQNRDELVIGRGPDLSLLRTYNSQGLLDGDNNDNWRIGVYRKVFGLTGTTPNAVGSTVKRVAEDGSEATYAFDTASGKYTSAEGGGAFDTLAYDATAQTWTWTDGDSQVTERYDWNNGGRITQVLDADGNGLTFTYNAAGLITQVTDAGGEKTFLDYSGTNLTRVRTVNAIGETLVRTRYAYDTANRLIQVVTDLSPTIAVAGTPTEADIAAAIADGKVYGVTYTYDDTSKRIASITQTDGNKLSFSYVQVGTDWRVSSFTDATGKTTNITYTQGGTSVPTSASANNAVLSTTETQTTPQTFNLNAAALTSGAGGGNKLQNWSTVNSISGALNSWTYYSIDVPAGQSELFVGTSGGTGDGDLYVRYGAQPDGTTFDAKSVDSGDANEATLIRNPAAGTWYIGVLAFSAISGVQLHTHYASGTAGTTVLQPGIAAGDLYGPAANERAFSFNVPAGTSSFKVALAGQAGQDVDLYLKFGTPPTAAVSDFRSDGSTANESISVNVPQAGTWYALVRGFTHYTDAALVLHTNLGTNTPPTVQAGATQSVTSGGAVSLSAAGSDAQGAVTYQWTQIAGPAVTLANAATATASFTAPGVSVPTQLDFRVRVTDSGGATNTDIVHVIVLPAAGTYSVKAQDSWQLIATALYGSSSVATQLQTALGSPQLIQGNVLTGFPASLTGTATTNVTVAPYYTVSSTDSWTSITQKVYGTSDASAVGALQVALGNPTLTEGLHLRVLQTLQYNVTVGNAVQADIVDPLELMTSLFYDGAGQIVRALTPAVGGTRLETRYAYDAQGNVKSVTDARGNVVTYGYDARGNRISERDALGNTVERVYGAKNELLAETTYSAVTTTVASSTGEIWTLKDKAKIEGTPPYLSLSGLSGTYASTPDTVANPFTGDLEFVMKVAPDSWTSGTQHIITKRDNANQSWAVRLVPSDSSAKIEVIKAGPDGTGNTSWSSQSSVIPGTVAGQAKWLKVQLDVDNSAGGAVFNYWASDDGVTWTAIGTQTVNGAAGPMFNGANAVEIGSAFSGVDRVFQGKIYYADIRNGIGGQIVANFDPSVGVTRQPAAPLTARYLYDAKNHLRFVVSQEGRVTEHRYNPQGQRIATIQYTGALYTLAGLTPASTLTEAQLTAWLPVDKSASVRSDTVYDFRGQVASVTTYARVDAAGAGIADGSQSVTQYIYDQAGSLLQTIDPRGAANPSGFTTTYAYDGLGRLRTATDALQRMTVTDYDDAGRKTVLTLANGLVSTSTYDATGMLVSVLQSGSGLASAETRYFYDADGRLRRAEDPTGVRTHVLYDEAGRKIGEIDGDGSLTEYRYDAAGNLTRTIRYATAVSQADLASLVAADGKPTSVTLAAIRPIGSSADRSTWNVYDVANRLVESVDESGAVTQYFYDAADRLTEVLRYATRIATGALGDAPAAGNVSPAFSAGDRLSRNFYDGEGRLRGSLDGEGFLVEYKYDAAGQLVETIGYANPTETAAGLRITGTLAQLVPAANALLDIHSYTLYNARGQVAGMVDGEGYLTETVYDLAGNKTQVIRYATRVAYTAGATLASLRPAGDPQDHATAYAYDALGRVTDETNYEGTLTKYFYDQVGNLEKTIKAANFSAETRTLTARYNKLGRVTQELSAKAADLLTGTQTQAEIDAIWAANAVKHAYDAAGRRISTTDAIGNKTRFYYDADGRLRYTINAYGEVRESAYNALGQLTRTIDYGTRIDPTTLAGLNGGLTAVPLAAVGAIANATLDSKTEYGYALNGLVAQTTDAENKLTTQTYNAFGELSGRIQAVDASTTLEHQYGYDRRGLLTLMRWDPTGANTSLATVYDAFGRATQTTDARGNVSKSEYDRLGRVVTTRDRFDKPRSTAYDAFDRLLTQTDALGKITTYSYNPAERSATVTTPEKIATTTFRNRHGETVSIRDGRGNVTTYKYDKNGKLTEVARSGQGVVTNVYDKADLLRETTDALGAKITYEYDPANRMSKRTVDAGAGGPILVTTTVYDAKGQTYSVTDPSGVVTRTTFDLKGQLTEVAVDPVGLNLRTAYSYDARGKVLTVTEGAGSAQPRVTRYGYDKLGRRTSEQVDGIAAATTYAYDKNDNVIRKTDALGNVTRYFYDAGDRLVYSVDALGGVTKNEYDLEGRLTRRTDYATAIGLAGLGDATTLADINTKVVAAASALDHTKGYVYDTDGREIYCVDAMGGVKQKFYDANGNLVREVRYANPIPLTTALNPTAVAGAVALVAGADDRTVRTVYDSANRAAFMIDAAGAVTQITYDNAGNAVKEVRYTNALQGTFTDNVAPQIVSAAPASGSYVIVNAASAAKDRVTRSIYDAAGRKRYEVDAEGYVTERRFDALGHEITRIRYPAPVVVADGATVAGMVNLFPTVPATAALEQAVYDKAGRLTDIVDGENVRTKNAYDALGHKTDVTRASGTAAASTTHYVYDDAGRLIEETAGFGSADAATTRYGLDALGNRRSIVDPRGIELAESDSTWALATRNNKLAASLTATEKNDYLGRYTTTQEFDALGRRKQVKNAVGGITLTNYDAFGNAVKITDPRGNIGYFYFDRLDRATLQVDPEGYVTESRYENAFANATRTVRYANRVVGTVSPSQPPAIVAAPLASGPYVLIDAARDQTTVVQYDKRDLALKVTDAESWFEQYEYDAFGNKKSYRNKLGGTTSYDYDRVGNLKSETLPVSSLNALGQSVAVVNTYEYDARGNRKQQIEASGLPEQRVTLFEYDKLDRQTKKIGQAVHVFNAATNAFTDTGSPTEQTKYDARGNVIETIAPNGARTLTYYDALDRKIAEVGAEGALTLWKYNDGKAAVTELRYGDPIALPATAGGTRPLPVNDTNVREKRYTYDANYALTETRIPNVRGAEQPIGAGGLDIFTRDIVTTSTYDAAGNEVLRIDARNNPTYSYYDRVGQKILEVDAEKYLTRWERDAAGNVIRETRYAAKLPLAPSVNSDPAALLAAVADAPRLDIKTGTENAAVWPQWRARQGVAFSAGTLFRGEVTTGTASDGRRLGLGLDNGANGSASRRHAAYIENKTLHANYIDGLTSQISPDGAIKDNTTYVVEVAIEAGGTRLFVYEKGLTRAQGWTHFSALAGWGQAYAYGFTYSQPNWSVTQDGVDNLSIVSGTGANLWAENFNLATDSLVFFGGNDRQAVAYSEPNRVTEFVYDRMSRVTERRALNVEYGTGSATNSTAVANAVTLFRYNGLGQVIQQTDATGAVSDIGYDVAGRKTKEQGAQFTDFEGAPVRPTTDYEYDGLNQVKRELVRGKNSAVETDDRITTYQYDYGFGARLVAQTDPTGARASFAYDLAGNIVSRSMVRGDADGASVTDRTNYGYDLLGRETARKDIGTGQTNDTRYNVYGDVTGKRTNGGGGPTGMWQETAEYDAAGRVWKTNSGDGSYKVHLYDASGNATVVIQSAGPDFAPLTLAQVMNGVPDDQKYLTISQYDARNQLVGSFQPKMLTLHEQAAIGQFITQATGAQLGAGGVSIGAIVNPKVPFNVADIGQVSAVQPWSVSATTTLRFTSISEVWGAGGSEGANGIWALAYVSPNHQISLTLPDTSALGSGHVLVDFRLEGVPSNALGGIPPYGEYPWWESNLAGYSNRLIFDYTERNPTRTFVESTTDGLPPRLAAPNSGDGTYLSQFQAAYFGPSTAGYIGRAYSYTVWKETAYGLVRLADFGGRTAAPGTVERDAIAAQNWGSGGSSSLREIHFQAQNSKVDRLVLQYRQFNQPWNTLEVPKRVDGWFAFDWTNWTRGNYQIWYTALDANGNVLNSERGTMTLVDGAASINQTPQTWGGPGRAFMAPEGLHILEQGSSADTLTIRYRHAGTSEAWGPAVAVPKRVIGNVATRGWFLFNLAGLSGAYDYWIEAKNASGAQVNTAMGTFTVGNPDSVSALIAPPDIVHFLSQPVAATRMQLSWRPAGSIGDFSPPIQIFKRSTGFDWDASALVLNRLASSDYEFRYETFDAANVTVNKGHGAVRLGASAVPLNHFIDLPTLVSFNPPQANATRLDLQYRNAGSIGGYTRLTLTRASAAQAFVWDASAVAVAGVVTRLEFIYDLLDAAGAPVRSPDGLPVRVVGGVTIGAVSAPTTTDWIIVGTSNPEWSIHRTQAYNAFGEVAQEIDGLGRISDLRYNSLGRLVQKRSPETNITLPNGFIVRGRPTTRYGYDLTGRLVGVTDANGNVNGLQLLAGSGLNGDQAKVTTEIHADGGMKVTAYDVFGDARKLTDEIQRLTLQEYDKLGRLIRVVHPQRAASTPGNETATAVSSEDRYAYDQAGNRISRTDARSATEKTYYDSLGRVTRVMSFAGYETKYSYVADATILGAGGVQVGGWLKTTTDVKNADIVDGVSVVRTLQDKVDVFGRLTWHQDLNGRTFAYSYNQAGWLTSQKRTDTIGQDIVYDYYANGYIKSIDDRASGSFTKYEYDAEGNRIQETYITTLVGGNREPQQSADVEYDELNRVKRVVDPKADVRYEYDANGNRLRVWSYYHDGIDGAILRVQDYRYDYDKMNRFVVTMGELSGAPAASAADTTVSVRQGTTGVRIGYDAAGQRKSAIYGFDGHVEDYTYTADGYLEDTKVNGALRARRFNDALGRAVRYQEYDPPAAGSTAPVPTLGKLSEYDGDSKLLKQTEYKGAVVTGTVSRTLTNDYIAAPGTTNDAGALGKSVSVSFDAAGNPTTITSVYAYDWWDDAKVKLITAEPFDPRLAGAPKWLEGYSYFEYDANGHLMQVNDPRGLRAIRFVDNAQGLVLARDEISGGTADDKGRVTNNGTIDKHHVFYYLDGSRIGDIGNDGPLKISYAEELAKPKYASLKEAYKNWTPISSADFDQNFEPIGPNYPAPTPWQYTVRSAGETLRSIAQTVFGDGAMWYLIADANGLTTASQLQLVAGQTLTIPNKVANIHNDSTTYRVYDPGEIMGDVSPIVPDAPPPPPPPGGKHGGCGGFGKLLVIVVAVAVSLWFPGAIGLVASSLEGVMAGAVAGNVASQFAGNMLGVQDGFSLKSVVASGLTAGLTYGALSGLNAAGANIPTTGGSLGQALARGAVQSVVGQGVNVAMGLQEKFDWRAVAMSAVSGGIDNALGGSALGSRVITGLAGAIVRRALFGQKVDLVSVAGNAIGQELGERAAGYRAPNSLAAELRDEKGASVAPESGEFSRVTLQPPRSYSDDQLRDFNADFSKTDAPVPEHENELVADAEGFSAALRRKYSAAPTADGAGFQADMARRAESLYRPDSSEIGARPLYEPDGTITGLEPSRWQSFWGDKDVQHMRNEPAFKLLFQPLISLAGSFGAAFVRSDGYDFNQLRYLNPKEVNETRTDLVIQGLATPLGGAIVRAELAETRAAALAYAADVQAAARAAAAERALRIKYEIPMEGGEINYAPLLMTEGGEALGYTRKMQDAIVRSLGEGEIAGFRSRPAFAHFLDGKLEAKPMNFPDNYIAYPNGERVARIVQPDGTVTEWRVVSDLDVAFGLKDGKPMTPSQMQALRDRIYQNYGYDVVRHPDLRTGVSQGFPKAWEARDANTHTFAFDNTGFREHDRYQQLLKRYFPK